MQKRERERERERVKIYSVGLYNRDFIKCILQPRFFIFFSLQYIYIQKGTFEFVHLFIFPLFSYLPTLRQKAPSLALDRVLQKFQYIVRGCTSYIGECIHDICATVSYHIYRKNTKYTGTIVRLCNSSCEMFFFDENYYPAKAYCVLESISAGSKPCHLSLD